MTLAALIRKRETGKSANDNPAKAANDGWVKDEPLAGLAALALAKPTSQKTAINQLSHFVSHDLATEKRQRRAASEVAAIVCKEAANPEEREVVNWLERILEADPVVYRETLAKCRTNLTYRAAFLNMARGDDAGAVH